MDRFGLIGYPVDHSLSPALFRVAYGGRWEYDLIGCASFDECMKLFDTRYRGVNVTTPFKEAAALRADIPAEEVLTLGAANILVRTERGLEAHNSDYLGIRLFLEKEHIHGPVLVVGAGGAGRAAALAARDCGLDVCVCNRSSSRAIPEGVSLHPLSMVGSLAGGAELVIWCLPCTLDGLASMNCQCLLEANYRDPAFGTESVSGRYIGGREWLKYQAISGFEILTGMKPDIDAICDAL